MPLNSSVFLPQQSQAKDLEFAQFKMSGCKLWANVRPVD